MSDRERLALMIRYADYFKNIEVDINKNDLIKIENPSSQ